MKQQGNKIKILNQTVKKTNLLIDTLTEEALTADLSGTEFEKLDEMDRELFFDNFISSGF